MAEYEVTFIITHTLTGTVEADSPEEVEVIAQETYDAMKVHEPEWPEDPMGVWLEATTETDEDWTYEKVQQRYPTHYEMLEAE